MRLVRAVLTALVLIGVLLAASGAAASDLPVTGYVGMWSNPDVIDHSARALTTVAIDGAPLTMDGKHLDVVALPVFDQRTRASALHLRSELLISNYVEADGDFSPAVAARMLRSATNRVAVVDDIATEASINSWEDITIDIEALTPADAAGYVTFLRQLDAALPAATTLSVDIGAAVSVAEYARGGFDLPSIAAIVDHVVLMAYDQHGPGWSKPGPIGGLPWQRRAIGAAITAGVPRSQLELGVAGYGYSWQPDGRGYSISPAAMRFAVRRNHVRAVWNATQGEWTARLENGTVLWWSDAKSWRLRYRLAEQQHLGGLAVWDLGQTDPIRIPPAASATAASMSVAKPAACTPTATCWRPTVGATMHLQLGGTVKPGRDALIYDVDGEGTPVAAIRALHRMGRKVACYVSAGSWEKYRPDAADYPDAVLGKVLDGWPDERWVDVRRIDLLAPLLTARIEACLTKGFDAVDFDNVDGYSNDTGFAFTAADQLRFNRWLADTAHQHGLAVALKNDAEQVAQLAPWFDFSVVESCAQYRECASYSPMIRRGKPVFDVEYRGSVKAFCPALDKLRMFGARATLALDGHLTFCA